MGIYFRTVFYSDFRNRDVCIVLSDIDIIIEESDRENGYVPKDVLLQYYGGRIRSEDIAEYSCIEEQEYSTYGPDSVMTCRLAVR